MHLITFKQKKCYERFRKFNNNFFKKGFVFLLWILFIGISILPLTEGIDIDINPDRIDINGIYYLRDDDPLNWADVGSLLKDMSIENETTRCGMFINFHFAQEGEYIGNNKIFNIYYHFWQKGFNNEEFEIGYSTSGEHSSGFNESIWIETNDYISEVNNYRLIQAVQHTNPEIAIFEDNEIYNFTIKFFGPNPNIICNPNQYSFIILNLEDNNSLQRYDRDNDLLNDYDELYLYFTNPFDKDTDNDGYSDYLEVDFGTDPNNQNDNLESNTEPKIPTINGPTTGKADIEYYYTFLSTDQELHDISYYVVWGDGHIEDWTINYSSGEEVTISHTWERIGEFAIMAKARDFYGAESDWGELKITISRKKIEPYQSIIKIIEQFPLKLNFYLKFNTFH